jgi:hypothetical protein
MLQFTQEQLNGWSHNQGCFYNVLSLTFVGTLNVSSACLFSLFERMGGQQMSKTLIPDISSDVIDADPSNIFSFTERIICRYCAMLRPLFFIQIDLSVLYKTGFF